MREARPMVWASGRVWWRQIRLLLSGLLMVMVLTACMDKPQPLSEKMFVGKWKSSRLATPVYLHENGEWEIKRDDGAVLDYGVWSLKERKLVWIFKHNGQSLSEANPVVLITPAKFQLRENDQTTSTFDRWE
jgi:hypothetical protein